MCTDHKLFSVRGREGEREGGREGGRVQSIYMTRWAHYWLKEYLLLPEFFLDQRLSLIETL